jgi:hypothetical protein
VMALVLLLTFEKACLIIRLCERSRLGLTSLNVAPFHRVHFLHR